MLQKLNPINKLLIFLVIFIAVLITARVIYTDSGMHIYLLWNIFLAIIPYAISRKFHKLKSMHLLPKTTVFFIWLLFFPNAMYLVTDLVHVSEATLVPLWYDVILLFSASFLGVLLSYLSLKHLQKEIFQSRFSKYSISLTGFVILISSFGVYLGRFMRWNSWDIISNPFSLITNVVKHFVYPVSHYKAWVFTVLFSIVTAFLFYSIDILRQKENANLSL